MSRNPQFYNSQAWRRLSKWKRQQNPLCEFCLALGIYTPSVDVDHKIPISTPEGWDKRLDSEGLTALCVPCHARHKARAERTGVLAGNAADGQPLDQNSAWYSR